MHPSLQTRPLPSAYASTTPGTKDLNFSALKGYAILAVLIGHLGFNGLERYVNYWHLPVFLFASGYFVKERHLTNLRNFIESRFKRLMIPFFLFGLLALSLHNILVSLHWIEGPFHGSGDTLLALKKIFINLSSDEEIVGAIWFLPMLFITSLIGSTVLRTAKSLRISMLAGGGITLLSLIFIKLRLPSPLGIFQILVISPLFFLAPAVRELKGTAWLKKHWIGIPASLLLVLAACSGIKAGCQASAINSMQGWELVLFPIGIAAAYYQVSCLGNPFKRVLAYFGDNSFVLMATHFFGFKAAGAVLNLYIPELRINAFPTDKAYIEVWWWVYLLGGILLPLMLNKLWNEAKQIRNCTGFLQKS